MRSVSIGGIDINNISFDQCIDAIEAAIGRRQPVYVVTPNVDHIVKLQKDREFQAIYRKAFLSVPDGVPLLWASRFLGTPLKERVNGTDLMTSLCARSAINGHRLFFLGGRPGATEKAKKKLESLYPGIAISGCYAPSLGFETNAIENAKILSMIQKAKPDILFVGLGAPKQEKWIFRWHHRTGVPVCIGVGASFEFLSGLLTRAPVWMQNHGLEWLWRLFSEPGRLWKRYLIDDLQFFLLVVRQKMTRNRDSVLSEK
jgi:N-acetylglucosaminyldiphosphoundecaprenol N-acetyl-beta-D-mannosaminyltransferase